MLTYACRYPDGAMDGPVTLYVDPASSLIAAYKFSGSADNAFGHVNYVYDARLEYGVDTVPNYSIRDEAACFLTGSCNRRRVILCAGSFFITISAMWYV